MTRFVGRRRFHAIARLLSLLARPGSGFVLSSAWVAACGSPEEPTSVLVEVTSDLEVGVELTALRVDFYDRTGANSLGFRNIQLTTQEGLPAQYKLPASFALTPASPDVTEFRLVVTGRGPLGGGEVIDVIERQAIGAFVRHEQTQLSVFLGRSCLSQLCRAAMDPRSDLTCVDGICVGTEQTPSVSATSSNTPVRQPLVQPPFLVSAPEGALTPSSRRGSERLDDVGLPPFGPPSSCSRAETPRTTPACGDMVRIDLDKAVLESADDRP